MTKYIATKSHNPCPVCADIEGKCRTIENESMVLCMSNVGAYKGEIINGYKFTGVTKNGSWGKFYPYEGNDSFNRDKWQQERKAKQLEKESAKRLEKQKQSLSVDERSQAWGEIIAQLTLADDHQKKLLDRGFTLEQIQAGGFRTIEKYQRIKSGNPKLAGVSSDGKKLTNSGRGILTPIKDDCDRVIGCQVRLDSADGSRYLWMSSASTGAKPNLQNGELPIGIYFPVRNLGEDFDHQNAETTILRRKFPNNISNSKFAIGIAEGASIKPQLAANKFGIVMIGAAGGQWVGSPDQLKAYLEKHHDKSKPVRIFPDGKPHDDDGVMRRLLALKGLLESWGYEVAIAWWGQFNKTDGDIDEITKEQFKDIEYLRWSDFEHLSTYVLRKPDVVLNQRYLAQNHGFDFLRDIPSDRYGIGTKSFKNTGKNYLQKTLAEKIHKSEDPKPILYVTQLTDLIKEASSKGKLGLVNIYEIENAKNDDIRKELILEASLFGLAVTYDSLLKIKALMPDFVPFQILLDEAESGCEALLDASTEIAKKRTETILYLSELMHKSKAKYHDAHMWMFDSDLTNVSIDFFCTLAGETLKDAFIVRNDYKVHQGKIAYKYSNPDAWLDAFVASSDRKICFSGAQKFNSKFSAQNLADLTGDSLTIDAETTKDKTHDAFRILKNNPIPVMKNYRNTIHTSSMGIGISIEEEGLFNSRWAISMGLLGVGKFLQTTDRYRPATDLHYFVPTHSTIGKYGSGSLNWKTLAKQTIKNNGDHIKAMAIADIENGTALLQKSIETHAKFMARRNYELKNYSQCVDRQLRLDGYKIVNVSPDGEIANNGDRLKEIKQTKIEQYCQAVPQADITDELEMKAIEKALERTPDERLKVAKKKLSDRYLIPVTPEVVKQDMEGIYSKLRLHYYLTIGAEYLGDRDKANLETLLGDDKLLFAPDANKWLLSGKIALLHKIGLPDFLANVGNDEITNNDDRVIKFNEKLISDFYRFPLLRHFGIKIDKEVKPLTNIEKVLGRIGRCLSRDEKSKKHRKAGGYQIIAISNLESAIFENWLKRDFREKINPSKPETTILRRKSPNNIVTGEFATGTPMQNIVAIAPIPIAQPTPQAENIPMAIAPSTPKTPNTPSPNHKPSNKPTQPPKNEAIDPYELRLRAWQRGWDGSPFTLMQYA